MEQIDLFEEILYKTELFFSHTKMEDLMHI